MVATAVLSASQVPFTVSVSRPFSLTRTLLKALRDLLFWEENVVHMYSYLSLRVWLLLWSSFQAKAQVHLSKKPTYYIGGILLCFKVYLSKSNSQELIYQDLKFIKVLFSSWVSDFSWYYFLNYSYLIQSLDSYFLLIQAHYVGPSKNHSYVEGKVNVNMVRGGPVQVTGLQTSWLRRWCLVYPIVEEWRPF